MTTHYEKIQALGNRMASNLETMGVSASFGDGGLTLADKILQIQHFTDGLLLWADKDIIQTGDTVNVYALLLDERKAVSGETIFFRGLETTQTLVANTETSVGNQYRFTNLPSSSSDWGNGKVYLNEEQTAYLHHNGDNIMLFANNRGYPISNNISIENGIITCYDSQTSYKHTIDISSTNTNKITSTISDVTITETMQGTTGSDGVATVSYTGKGTGVLNIQAYNSVRIIQSERYSIIDAITYDNATASDHKDIWELANATLVRENEYSRLSETNIGTNAYIYAEFPNVQTIEFDVLQEDGATADALFGFYQDTSAKITFQLRHLDDEMELNTWYRVKCIVEENKITIINKDTEYQTIREFTGIINRGRFATSGTTTALQFRNFKAY